MLERLVVQQNGDYSDQDEQQHNYPSRDPSHCSCPVMARTTRWFQRWLLRQVVKWKIALCAQNACPSVKNICVALRPAGAFKLCPISMRTGPTGVAYRTPKPIVLV